MYIGDILGALSMLLGYYIPSILYTFNSDIHFRSYAVARIVTYPNLLHPIGSRHLDCTRSFDSCYMTYNTFNITPTTFLEIRKGFNQEVIWSVYQITSIIYSIWSDFKYIWWDVIILIFYIIYTLWCTLNGPEGLESFDPGGGVIYSSSNTVSDPSWILMIGLQKNVSPSQIHYISPSKSIWWIVRVCMGRWQHVIFLPVISWTSCSYLLHITPSLGSLNTDLCIVHLKLPSQGCIPSWDMWFW